MLLPSVLGRSYLYTCVFERTVTRSFSFSAARFQSAVPLAYDLIESKDKQNDNPPIIIMHGLLGSKLNNRSLGRLLNEQLQRDIYLVDLRNHGRSPETEIHDYEGMSEDVLRFIKDHDLKKPILLGHSMGAKVGMSCVLRDKECASQLICLDNAPICNTPNGLFAKYIQSLRQICENKDIRSVEDADLALAAFEKDKFIRQFLLTTLKKVKDEITQNWGFEARIPLNVIHKAVIKGNISAWDFDPRKDRWVGPSLFLRGTDSGYLADEYLPTIGMFFPNFEVRDVKAGHYLNVTNAQECSDLIAEFINRHEDIE